MLRKIAWSTSTGKATKRTLFAFEIKFKSKPIGPLGAYINLKPNTPDKIAKLVENEVNKIPLGFSYARDADNTPLLKLITPNLLKIGRLHSRALDGPVKFPTGPKDLMVKVEQIYKAFFRGLECHHGP